MLSSNNKLSVFLVIGLCTVLSYCADYELTLLHVNDIHVRFEQINKYAGVCKQEDEDKGKCYGGIARLKKTVDGLKLQHENVIFLNGGDFYQGNVWYTHFKWPIVAQFTNILDFTATVNIFKS